MRSAPLFLLAATLAVTGCASSDNQRYFPPKHAARVEAQGVDLRILFVRQTVRELVVLVRLTNTGTTPLVLGPTDAGPAWSLAIDGRTVPMTETDRTYWSAWSGTVTRDKSPLKVARALAPSERVEVEVRWRLEPAVADGKAPWVLTTSGLRRGDEIVAPLTIAYPSPELVLGPPVETNPNRQCRPGTRGYTGIWFRPEDDSEP